MNRLRVMAFPVILLLAACSKPAPPAAKTPPSPVVWTDEMRASVTEFGKRFERAVAEKDLKFLQDHVDFSQMVEDYEQNPKVPRGLITGLKRGLEQGKANTAQNFALNKTTFIETREANGRPALLVRVDASGGIDYMELELKRHDPSSDWLICETYTFSAGMRTSDILGSMLYPAIQEMGQTPFERLTQGRKKEGEIAKHFPTLLKMMNLVKEGKAEEALKLWDELPDSIRRMKVAMYAHLAACGALPEPEKLNSPYHQSMQAFERAFPGDPALLLHAIDHRAVLGDFEGSHQAILQLKEQVAGDPYLEFFRSFYYLMEGNYAEAEARARAWRAEHPDDEDAVNVIYSCGLRTNNFKLLAESLDMYQEVGTDPDLENPELAPFLASPEGKAWLSAQ